MSELLRWERMENHDAYRRREDGAIVTGAELLNTSVPIRFDLDADPMLDAFVATHDDGTPCTVGTCPIQAALHNWPTSLSNDAATL